MTFDLSATALREDALRRLKAALAVFDEDLYSNDAVARWVSAAGPQQNRRRWLKAVVAARAARVYSGPALKDAGYARNSITTWDRAVHAEEMISRPFRTAVAAAVDIARARSMPEPKQFPTLQETDR